MSGAPAPSRRRASDLLALALVATSVGVVSVAAAPSVARELGLTSATLSRREPAHGLLGPGGVPLDEGGARGLRSPHGSDRPGAVGRGDPPEDADDEDPGDARLAVAVRDVVVRDTADERATSRGKIPRGELLIVIREVGAWAMVAHLGGEGSTTGWVRRGDLAIR